MTIGAGLPSGSAKEIRALLPIWLGGMLLVIAARLLGDPKYYALGVIGCGLATVALGAFSIGHEYSHRTLAVFLTQPSTRTRLFRVKAMVLVPLVLTLAAAAWVGLLNPLHQLDGGRSSHRWDDLWSTPVAIFLPVLVSLFFAPLLTMTSRGALAGMVFSACIPPTIGLAAQMLAFARFGWAGLESPASDRVAFVSFWWGMALVCVAAAMSTWLVFRRLEAIDGPARDLQFPDSWPVRTASSSSSRRHPIALLVRKEVRLQQMAFVVSALYLAGFVALASLRYFMSEIVNPPPLGALAVLYTGLQAILIGSLASAEERQLGTLQWQVLLPVSTARQWIVKAGTAFALALALGMGVAALLRWLDPSGDTVRINPLYFVAVIGLTATSLYVSTLCSSGVQAVLISLLGVPSVLLVFRSLDEGLAIALQRLGIGQLPPSKHALFVGLWTLLAMVLGYIALVLWLGMINHRSLDRAPARGRSQIVWIFCYVAVCLSVQWMVLSHA